jgi:outer membrane protein assembly factor BamE (lipoprotein component of BamABCDE complex)
MRNDKGKLLKVLMMFVMGTLVLVWGANAHAQRAQALVSTAPVVTQQPPYSDYKGVRLGMTAQEVRTKLGAPTMKSDEQDYFVLSDKETAQVGYDAAGKVKVISFDYMGGI